MTYTYDDTDLSTALARVRLAIGDAYTSQREHSLSDEEIQAILDQEPNESAASVICVRRILGKLARMTDRSAQGMSSSRSQMTNHYRDLLRDLQREIGLSGTVRPFGGMMSKAALDADKRDTDIPEQPRLGQDDYPGTYSSSEEC